MQLMGKFRKQNKPDWNTKTVTTLIILKVSNEKELEKSDSNHHCNIIFDSTGHFIMYATMIGIKLVNLYTNKG